ncbi:hypothetical protein V8E51_012633 [Hyaloscypha variabilis]
MFNLQLLNTTAFAQLVGIKPPPTTVTPVLYKKYGYHFIKSYEEKSGIDIVTHDAEEKHKSTW